MEKLSREEQTRLAAEWEAKLSGEGMKAEIENDENVESLEGSAGGRDVILPILQQYWAAREESAYGAHEQTARRLAAEHGVEYDDVMTMIHEAEDATTTVENAVDDAYGEVDANSPSEINRAKSAIRNKFPDFDGDALEMIFDRYAPLK